MLIAEEIDTIVEKYMRGEPVRKIMREHGIRGVAKFYKILDLRGVPRRRRKRPSPKIPEEVRKKICELRAKGWSYPRIAKELRISLGSAYRHSKKCEESQ